MLNKPKNSNFKGINRRRYERFLKNFILTYHEEGDPSRKIEITQLKNISLGGMCFVTPRKYSASSKLGIELKTPYLAGTAFFNGIVLESHEKMKDAIYDTRVEFSTPFDTESEILLKKLIQFFTEAKEHLYD